MVSIESFRQIALSLPAATEAPHFEKTSFRAGGKIFATLDIKNQEACIKLSLTDQNVFSAFDLAVICPVPNKWGLQGWTIINLQKVRKSMCVDAVKQAYAQVTAKQTVRKVKK